MSGPFGGGGPWNALPLNTKGDLLGFTNQLVRVPVGSDGQVLTADSTQAAGIKWAAAGGGGAAWGSITGTLSNQTDLAAALAAKAPLASPTFTGTVTAPATTTTYPINAVNTGLKRFTVTGNARLSMAQGQKFTVSGSTGNNGVYTVSSISYSAPNTNITVAETVPSAVADGNVTNIFGSVAMTDGQVALGDTAGDAFYMYVDSGGQFLIQCQPASSNRGVAPIAITKDASQMYFNVTTLTVGGTANFATLSATSMTGPAFTGDSGAGGTTGLVPAPAAGDAAAAKFLKADGTWAVPAGSGPSIVTAVKTSRTAYNATTTLANDPALQVTLAVGVYAFTGMILFYEDTSGVGGYKFDFGGGSATLSVFNLVATGYSNAAYTMAGGINSNTTVTSFANVLANTVSNPSFVMLSGTVTVTGAGTLIYRAAQNASSSNVTYTGNQSWLQFVKVA